MTERGMVWTMDRGGMNDGQSGWLDDGHRDGCQTEGWMSDRGLVG